jgi:general secretion pathway protein E
MVARLGERAVLTFETVETRADDLCALGMRPGLAASLADILARRAGLVLVAGPPGSGVSTTLAALARRADNGARCILSGDDDLPAVLGQDPDVVTIARIADRATAAAAIRAARERLVLAGIEASDSVSAILALRAFRAEPFDLAANLQAVLSQRLVGHLCAACREPVQAPRSISALLGFDSGTVVYAPAGCEACGNSGFTGRTAAFEAILPDTGLRRLIYDGGDGAILARHAFVAAPNLGSAARTLVREGVTTPEEAVRVSRG